MAASEDSKRKMELLKDLYGGQSMYTPAIGKIENMEAMKTFYNGSIPKGVAMPSDSLVTFKISQEAMDGKKD